MASGYPLQMRLTPEDLDALDSYCRQQKSPPSRPAAARDLMKMALKAAGLDLPEAVDAGAKAEKAAVVKHCSAWVV